MPDTHGEDVMLHIRWFVATLAIFASFVAAASAQAAPQTQKLPTAVQRAFSTAYLSVGIFG